MAQIVLLAVDDPNILYLLRRYVEECGMLAVNTSCDEDLTEAVTRARPVLIIADAVGGQAASKALRALRARLDTREIPVLLYGSESSHLVGAADPAIPHVASGFLQDYVLYDQFVAALRQFGVRPGGEVP